MPCDAVNSYHGRDCHITVSHPSSVKVNYCIYSVIWHSENIYCIARKLCSSTKPHGCFI